MGAIAPEVAIETALSVPRIATYRAATTGAPELPAALALYTWNAQVSAAMLNPLHACEVVIRNAVSDALMTVYGPNWPWSPGFYKSLPDHKNPRIFNPRKELTRARNGHHSTGKVVAELKFVFWQMLFTARFDKRLWNPHLRTALPYLDPTKTIQQLRKTVHDDLEKLRLLRNRIAHHEPIFRRVLADDLQTTLALIGFRCPITANWVMNSQSASALIGNQPP